MTEKQDETCENCGHDEVDHTQAGCFYHLESGLWCSCEKFKAKNHSPQELAYPVKSDSLSTEDKPSGMSNSIGDNRPEGTFNLSKKGTQMAQDINENVYWQGDVKEFIRRLKDVIFRKSKVAWRIVHSEIDKLAGDDLSK